MELKTQKQSYPPYFIPEEYILRTWTILYSRTQEPIINPKEQFNLNLVPSFIVSKN